jgi:dCMP deaminase
MNLARHIATWSKDQSRGVGCVIVGPDHEVISMGYNGFPRGIDDTVDERHQRPAKYSWTEHAERNAIYNAARQGVSTKGAVMYLPWYPCMDCARAIIQCGIAELVAVQPDWNDERWGKDFNMVHGMFIEVGLKVRFVE